MLEGKEDRAYRLEISKAALYSSGSAHVLIITAANRSLTTFEFMGRSTIDTFQRNVF